MSNTLHVFEYLSSTNPRSAAVCVVFGDEPFLKRLALQTLRDRVLGDADAPVDRFEGTEAEWRDVHDEVATVALFGGDRRLVIVDDADTFVTRYRDKLERYVDGRASRNVLVLNVTTWASNTRLYKLVDSVGMQIDCHLPEKATSGKTKVVDEARLLKWLVEWAQTSHRVDLTPKAARLLWDLAGPHLGMVDQDIAKLALFVPSAGQISPELVQDVVGGWRAQTVWEMIEAACDGDAAAALLQFDRLLQSVDSPIGLFAQFSWSLRRFAAATRLYEQAERRGARPQLATVLAQAGFRDWPRGAMQRAERQLKQMGRERAGQIHRWLLEADLALKRSHSSPERARWVLERLVLRLAKELNPRALSSPATGPRGR